MSPLEQNVLLVQLQEFLKRSFVTKKRNNITRPWHLHDLDGPTFLVLNKKIQSDVNIFRTRFNDSSKLLTFNFGFLISCILGQLNLCGRGRIGIFFLNQLQEQWGIEFGQFPLRMHIQNWVLTMWPEHVEPNNIDCCFAGRDYLQHQGTNKQNSI